MRLQDAIMTGGSQIVSWLWNMYNFELRLILVLLEKQQQNTVLENPQKSSIQISLCQIFLLRIPFFFRHFFTMFFCDNAVPKWPKTFWVIFKHCAVAAKKKFSLEAERNVETVVWKEEVFLPLGNDGDLLDTCFSMTEKKKKILLAKWNLNGTFLRIF